MARATVAEPNLSGFVRSESQQSGDGCHDGDECLGWAGLAGLSVCLAGWLGQWEPARTGRQVRAWTPHLMCFDNGDRMRKGWADGGQVAR